MKTYVIGYKQPMLVRVEADNEDAAREQFMSGEFDGDSAVVDPSGDVTEPDSIAERMKSDGEATTEVERIIAMDDDAVDMATDLVRKGESFRVKWEKGVGWTFYYDEA